ncbi:MAG: PASTA domain-containing protein [Actinomycetota bacterium]
MLRGTRAVVAIVLTLLVLGACTEGSPRPAPTPTPSKVHVPRVIGLSFTKATSTLAEAGLGVGEIEQQIVKDVRTGVVISQRPRPGSLLPAGASVDLTVAS